MMFLLPSVICTLCTGFFCLAIIKGPPNDNYFIIEGPCLDYFTEKVSQTLPVSFVSHFHASTGRPRKHQLYPMLKALLLQRIFSIPTDTLLIVFLKYSQELRDFCGFDVVPDASKFTRFKQDFLMDLQSMFNHMVDMNSMFKEPC